MRPQSARRSEWRRSLTREFLRLRDSEVCMARLAPTRFIGVQLHQKARGDVQVTLSERYTSQHDMQRFKRSPALSSLGGVVFSRSHTIQSIQPGWELSCGSPNLDGKYEMARRMPSKRANIELSVITTDISKINTHKSRFIPYRSAPVQPNPIQSFTPRVYPTVPPARPASQPNHIRIRIRALRLFKPS
jgi:hypothetical protein